MLVTVDSVVVMVHVMHVTMKLAPLVQLTVGLAVVMDCAAVLSRVRCVPTTVVCVPTAVTDVVISLRHATVVKAIVECAVVMELVVLVKIVPPALSIAGRVPQLAAMVCVMLLLSLAVLAHWIAVPAAVMELAVLANRVEIAPLIVVIAVATLFVTTAKLAQPAHLIVECAPLVVTHSATAMKRVAHVPLTVGRVPVYAGTLCVMELRLATLAPLIVVLVVAMVDVTQRSKTVQHAVETVDNAVEMAIAMLLKVVAVAPPIANVVAMACVMQALRTAMFVR